MDEKSNEVRQSVLRGGVCLICRNRHIHSRIPVCTHTFSEDKKDYIKAILIKLT